MKVLVLGSGVVGVTSAWYLAQAGHEVTVIDRQPGPARETSFANAGEISPGYSSPWAGPGVPVKAIKWMLMHFGPLVVRPKFDPYMALWLVKMLRNCTSARYARNKSRMVPSLNIAAIALKRCVRKSPFPMMNARRELCSSSARRSNMTEVPATSKC